jgi:hypothetical protein
VNRSPGRGDESADVTYIAGQDAVAGGGHGHDAGVDGIGHAGEAKQDAGGLAQVFVDGFDVDRPEQPGELRLAPGGASPYWVTTTPVVRNANPA